MGTTAWHQQCRIGCWAIAVAVVNSRHRASGSCRVQAGLSHVLSPGALAVVQEAIHGQRSHVIAVQQLRRDGCTDRCHQRLIFAAGSPQEYPVPLNDAVIELGEQGVNCEDDGAGGGSGVQFARRIGSAAQSAVTWDRVFGLANARQMVARPMITWIL